MATLDIEHRDPKVMFFSSTEKAKAAQETFNKKAILYGGIALGVLVLAIGATIAAYFINPQPFQDFFTSQIGVANGLLYIGVPLLAAGIVIRLIIHVAEKYHKAKEECDTLRLSDNVKEVTLSELKPTKKQVITATIVVLALAALAAGGYLLFTHLPAAGQWLNHSVVNNHIQMWQAFAYIGGGSAALVITTSLVLHIIQKINEAADNKKKQEDLEEQYPFIYEPLTY